MRRIDSTARILLTLLFVYLFSLGATFNGVLIPWASFLTLALMGALLLLWLWLRRWGEWHWHETPLDRVFLLWAAAFVLALLANTGSWRRILIGLWYVGVYVGVWYVLHDAIANRFLKRDVIVDAFLIAGLIVVGFGYFQMRALEFDLSRFELPRPGSVVGNPNALGAFLVVLLALVGGRLLGARDRLGRILLGGYTLAVLLLIFATFSRGAWVATIVVIAALMFLALQMRSLASVHDLRNWWWGQTGRVRGALSSLAILMVVAGMIAAALFVQSFSARGRGLRLRTFIWEDALAIFAQEPVTGHGLFTFGKHFTKASSHPPLQPHSHAHNTVFHIAAELGIVGLIALLVTLAVIFRTLRDNWHATPQRNKGLLAGAVAAVAGFAVHHLLDMPAMMPLVALVGLIALVIAIVPVEPVPVTSRRRQVGFLLGLLGLWVVLLVTGVWSTAVYNTYNTALRYGILDEEYRGGAERMQPAIDADPDLALYHSQQAYLYGVAAGQGDTEALELAVAAYERFLELEPQNAIGWTNLAALHWQAGRQDSAVEAMLQAVNLAPQSWQLKLNLGMYAETVGNEELARETYQAAVNEQSRLLPFWDETSLRREIAAEYEASGLTAMVLALTEETVNDADALWRECDVDDPQSTSEAVVCSLLVVERGAVDDAQRSIEQARLQAETDADRAWIHLGRMAVARYNGEEQTAERELAAARELVAPDFTEADYITGTNIAHFQFLRYTIPRQFLPQVDYPAVDPALLRLLENS